MVVRDKQEIQRILQSLRRVGSNDLMWEVYFEDEDNVKWIKTYESSNLHGGGNLILKMVNEFPKYSLDHKDVYEGKEAFIKSNEIDFIQNDRETGISYYLDRLSNEKWRFEYSNSIINGELIKTPKITKIDRFPWE